MEIKGEEFLKKVKIRQEKDELEEKLSELRQHEQNIYSQDQEVIKDEKTQEDNPSTSEFELNISQSSKNAYENISLDEIPSPKTNQNKTKNYLILGAVLIILFLLTIITFKFIMGDSEQKEDSFTSSTNVIENTKENAVVDSNFQKIMNEKKKREEELKQSTVETNSLESSKIVEENSVNPMSDTAMNETIEKVKQKELNSLSETQKVIRDIENKQIENKPIVVKEPEIKQNVQKTTNQSKVKDLVKDIDSTSIKVYFVQVGAFTKTPSQNYINNIKKANLKYKVYTVEVNGVLYNKVLIGPYTSRANAKQDIDNIKKKLNLSSAFVLKF